MRCAMLLVLPSLLLPASAAAKPAGQRGSTAPVMADADSQSIIVTGQQLGYLALQSVTATRTDTLLADIPQTISVVTRAQLDDQAQYSLGDVLRYVPGTTVGQGEGNRDQVTLRGQNTTADFFLDGVRDDVQYYRGLYNIDRVEILKGPYALIFGRGGGGGIINRVQKTPQLGGFAGNARASVNSFGAHDVALDVNAPLGGGAALRVNGTYERIDNHRDFNGGDRYALNPYVAADIGGWRIGLSYEYVNDRRTTDRGVPSLGGAPITGYRDRFFGVPGVNDTSLEAHIAKLRFDGQLAPNLSASSTILYGDFDKTYSNVFANGPATAIDGTVPLAGYIDPTTRQNLIVQTSLVWTVATGGIDHKLLGGLEYGDQRSGNLRRDATLSSARISLVDPVFPTVTFNSPSRDRSSTVTVLSAFVQDQIGVADAIDVVLGLRYDRFDIAGVDRIAEPDRAFGRVDENVSPRVGVIVKPIAAVSLYASYSQSFLPRSGDQFLALTPTQQNLAPERFTNYEVGAKWSISPGLAVNAALFQLDRTNATTPDPGNPGNSINVGQTRTRGAEIGVTGQIVSGWQVSGGYTYQDAKLRGNDAVRLGQVPEHQFALWNRIDLADTAGVGLGTVYQSSQFAAIRTGPATTRLPGFTRFDLALFYKLRGNAEVQVNIENLFDTVYFADAHNNDNISTGAPLNGRVTLRFMF